MEIWRRKRGRERGEGEVSVVQGVREREVEGGGGRWREEEGGGGRWREEEGGGGG